MAVTRSQTKQAGRKTAGLPPDSQPKVERTTVGKPVAKAGAKAKPKTKTTKSPIVKKTAVKAEGKRATNPIGKKATKTAEGTKKTHATRAGKKLIEIKNEDLVTLEKAADVIETIEIPDDDDLSSPVKSESGKKSVYIKKEPLPSPVKSESSKKSVYIKKEPLPSPVKSESSKKSTSSKKGRLPTPVKAGSGSPDIAVKKEKSISPTGVPTTIPPYQSTVEDPVETINGKSFHGGRSKVASSYLASSKSFYGGGPNENSTYLASSKSFYGELPNEQSSYVPSNGKSSNEGPPNRVIFKDRSPDESSASHDSILDYEVNEVDFDL